MDGIDSSQLVPALQNLSQADRAEITQFVERNQQQDRVSEIVHSLSSTCFKKCVTGKITTDSLSSGEQSCAQNCVSRWIDVQQSILKNLSGQQTAPAAQGKTGFFG